MKSNSRVYVIGIKLDTDSICSAIAYADIKNRTDKPKPTWRGVPVRSMRRPSMY